MGESELEWMAVTSGGLNVPHSFSLFLVLRPSEIS